MLSLDHVSFQYDNAPILQNLSHTFADGVTTAITGASGSGKTTLLHLLAGLYRPTSGKVCNTYSRLAVSFQEPRLFPWMTALENVTAVCKNRNQARAYLQALFAEEDVADKFPDELSGGMKMRVSLARALAVEPDLLLLDEPFFGLDPETKQRTAEFLFAQMQQKTCIFITHAEEDLAFCAEHLHLSGLPVTSLCAVKHGKASIE